MVKSPPKFRLRLYIDFATIALGISSFSTVESVKITFKCDYYVLNG